MSQLIPHFISKRFAAGETNGSFTGYAIFVDMSGFTKLTESLMKKGKAGAEELSDILNQIFSPLVSLMYEHGAFIPYFAGDAFTAIFPKATAKQVYVAALKARAMFSDNKISFKKHAIGLKTGIAYGQISWGIVGEKQKSYYFKGGAINLSAKAQMLADNLDIIVDQSFFKQLGSDAKRKTINKDFYKMTPPKSIPALQSSIANHFKKEPNSETIVHFVPPELRTENKEGEFRNVVAVFIAFQGIEEHDLMNEFASYVIDHFLQFSGYFKEIDFGDKGGLLLGFFGAPVSYENNATRALEFVLSLQESMQEIRQFLNIKIKIGLSMGTAFTGMIGGKERSQYACVGSRVNLAVRLMSKAKWDTVLTTEELTKNTIFAFDKKGNIQYKGITGEIPTFQLKGRRRNSSLFTYNRPFVARDSELAKLEDLTKGVFTNEKTPFVQVLGEAGIGKSRLMHEFRKSLQTKYKLNWFVCSCDQILRKAFNPFIFFLKNYFGQNTDANPEAAIRKFNNRFDYLVNQLLEEKSKNFESYLQELHRTKDVLKALCGLKLDNDSIWHSLDARGRFQNTLSAITNLLDAESVLAPIFLIIEDTHWLDESSLTLLRLLVTRKNNNNITFLATSRYNDDGSVPDIWKGEEITPTTYIHLNSLSEKSVKQYAKRFLNGEISEEFHALLIRATNNNPFYLEQLLEYFRETDQLKKTGELWNVKDANIRISTSINAILTARIDRLSSLVKDTVKTAAVIGREFEIPILSEVMKQRKVFAERGKDEQFLLNTQIKTAEKFQIWRAVNELRYIFRHALLREAVYDMQLNTRLKELHRLIALAIEKIYEQNLAPRYEDLAFHFEQAKEHEKMTFYLEKAAIFAHENYQNNKALNYYNKLLQNIKQDNNENYVAKVHLRIAKVLQHIGMFDQSEEQYFKALEISKLSDDAILTTRIHNNLGRLLTLKGRYDTATKHLNEAVAEFENQEDQIGLTKALGHIGALHFRQGNYEQAEAYLVQSIQYSKMRGEASGMAAIVSTLGLTYMNRGNYEAGIQVQEDSLKIAAQKGRRQDLATLYTNTGIVYFEKGDYTNALSCYENGLKYSEELGNKLLTSINIGCMGSVYQARGDFKKAMELFEEDLRLCEEMGDKQGTAIALGLIGEHLTLEGKFDKAIEYLQKNLMLCQELGYQKGIAKSCNTLGDVFYFTRQYDRSLKYYDRAIVVTRKINNKLVLGESLLEKGRVYVKLKNALPMPAIIQEAFELAEELGNEELLFETEILNARVMALNGEKTDALEVLTKLLQKELSKEDKANILYEISKLKENNSDEANLAQVMYKELYAKTANYLYSYRLDRLKKLTL